MEEKKTPQWQTGPIPKPSGPAVLVAECRFKQEPELFSSYYHTSNNPKHPSQGWSWPYVSGTPINRPDLDWSHMYTGRWYIQAINIPTK